MKILSQSDVFASLTKLNSKREYIAMYSSLFGGVVTDPALMLVPLDDHIVHRGDGVFEAIRTTASGMYLVYPHLERLYRSAKLIDLKVSVQINELHALCKELVEIGKLKNQGMLRIFVSRGPGDFSPSPYSTMGSQLYIAIMDFKSMPQSKYDEGVSVMTSKIPVKQAPYATVKSCNYLHNVLMKKESIDNNFDFSVGVSSDGYLAEGPTENIMIVNKSGELLAPNFDYTLRGTTLVRAMELAENQLRKDKNFLNGIRVADIHMDELASAREIMMVGTTLSVLPVTKFGPKSIGGGKPGPVAKKLCELVNQDMGI
jgi:4-amino-4-deoxychorismate lyase